MSCPNPPPTSTQFGTQAGTITNFQTVLTTDVTLITSDVPVFITTCSPVQPVPGTVSAAIPTCVPRTLTTIVPSVITSTVVRSSVQTITTVTTSVFPTRTLFGPCPDGVPPDPAPVTTTVQFPTTTPTPDVTPDTPTTTKTTSKSTYLGPVTLTRTFTSTDPYGSLAVFTSESVSTPDPTKASSGGANTPAIVGGVVGGVVGCIVLIGIVWFIMWRRKSGKWNDIFEEEEEADEPKPTGPPNPQHPPTSYAYGALGQPPQPSSPRPYDGAFDRHSHHLSISSAGYVDHARSNSQTPLMSVPAMSPPQSPPSSPPFQPPQLPGPNGGLERRGTPIWASRAAQDTYFHPNHPPMSSDPNFSPNRTSTYSVTPPPHSMTAASPYIPPGAAAPAVLGRRPTVNDYNPPLVPPPQGLPYQSGSSMVAPPVDSKAEFYSSAPAAAGSISGNTYPRFEKAPLDVAGGGGVSPIIEPPTRTNTVVSAMRVAQAQDVGRTSSPAPPPYTQQASV